MDQQGETLLVTKEHVALFVMNKRLFLGNLKDSYCLNIVKEVDLIISDIRVLRKEEIDPIR